MTPVRNAKMTKKRHECPKYLKSIENDINVPKMTILLPKTFKMTKILLKPQNEAKYH